MGPRPHPLHVRANRLLVFLPEALETFDAASTADLLAGRGLRAFVVQDGVPAGVLERWRRPGVLRPIAVARLPAAVEPKAVLGPWARFRAEELGIAVAAARAKDQPVLRAIERAFPVRPSAWARCAGKRERALGHILEGAQLEPPSTYTRRAMLLTHAIAVQAEIHLAAVSLFNGLGSRVLLQRAVTRDGPREALWLKQALEWRRRGGDLSLLDLDGA
jgi:hypothetical protein